MPAVLAAFFVACILPVTLEQGRPGGRASFDIVRIDGAKNPEMIPEWSAWEFALSVLAKGPGEIPAELIPHYSEQESAILLKAPLSTCCRTCSRGLASCTATRRPWPWSLPASVLRRSLRRTSVCRWSR